MSSSLGGLPSSLKIFFEKSNQPQSNQDKTIEKIREAAYKAQSSLKALNESHQQGGYTDVEPVTDDGGLIPAAEDVNLTTAPSNVEAASLIPAKETDAAQNISTIAYRSATIESGIKGNFGEKEGNTGFLPLENPDEILFALPGSQKASGVQFLLPGRGGIEEEFSFDKEQEGFEAHRQDLQRLKDIKEAQRAYFEETQRKAEQTHRRMNREPLIEATDHQAYARTDSILTAAIKEQIQVNQSNMLKARRLNKFKAQNSETVQASFSKIQVEDEQSIKQFLRNTYDERLQTKRVTQEHFFEKNLQSVAWDKAIKQYAFMDKLKKATLENQVLNQQSPATSKSNDNDNTV